MSSPNIQHRSVSSNEHELYVRLLLPKKRGFPLWNPEANENLPGGVFPGVVGILDEFGGFDYLFTATLPADDQLNSGGVPPGFRELRINRSDINTLNDDPGSYIASNPAHIHKTILPGQSRIPYA